VIVTGKTSQHDTKLLQRALDDRYCPCAVRVLHQKHSEKQAAPWGITLCEIGALVTNKKPPTTNAMHYNTESCLKTNAQRFARDSTDGCRHVFA